MPKIDMSNLELRTGSVYPEPYNAMMQGRSSLRLGAAGGLTQFGANLVFLEPGAKSSMRHWHEQEDEFLIVTEGELVLIDDAGESPLRVGDCAAFPAGDANGHHIVNNSDKRGAFLVVGTKAATETAHYSDIDMVAQVSDGNIRFHRRDGSPIP